MPIALRAAVASGRANVLALSSPKSVMAAVGLAMRSPTISLHKLFATVNQPPRRPPLHPPTMVMPTQAIQATLAVLAALGQVLNSSRALAPVTQTAHRDAVVSGRANVLAPSSLRNVMAAVGLGMHNPTITLHKHSAMASQQLQQMLLLRPLAVALPTQEIPAPVTLVTLATLATPETRADLTISTKVPLELKMLAKATRHSS